MPTANSTTQQVIEFLSQPSLPFGSEEDVLLLSDPEALQTRITTLLDENPTVLDGNAEELKSKLAEADWPLIAQEFRARVAVASGFFDGDAQAAK